MDEIAAHKDSPTVLTDIPRYAARPVPAESALERPRIPPLNIALFLLTMLTATTAGAYMNGEEVSIFHPLLAVAALRSGLLFSIPLMAILLAHEMGHYLTSRYHGVPTSLPYFIPAPPSIFIFGTFGAFIRMKAMPRTRRVMFDIGAAGPWAGVILAIPAVMIGLYLSDVTPLDKSAGGLELGNSLLFLALSRIVLGVDPSMVNVNLHPIAFAGWIGLLVTSLNLLPVGQLDGGHVIYALFPRRHRTISTLFVDVMRADGRRPARVGPRTLVGMATMGGAVDRARIGTSVNRRSRHSAQPAPRACRVDDRGAVHRHVQSGAARNRAARASDAAKSRRSCPGNYPSRAPLRSDASPFDRCSDLSGANQSGGIKMSARINRGSV